MWCCYEGKKPIYGVSEITAPGGCATVPALVPGRDMVNPQPEALIFCLRKKSHQSPALLAAADQEKPVPSGLEQRGAKREGIRELPDGNVIFGR